MTKYKLTVSEQQAAIIANALDLFSRIGLGQFEEIMRVYDRNHVVPLEAREQARNFLKAAKIEVGHTSNGSFGIHSPKVSDDFRAAYDLLQVIRHRLAWDRNPEGNRPQVDFDPPSPTSALPLAQISQVGNKADEADARR
jgi:hypothetical protein